jgi:asparagine synthetase B (glutamine-hydrolysing)
LQRVAELSLKDSDLCEIAGFTQFRLQSAGVAELMRRMTSPLTPRGPDSERFHVTR